jgi:aconitate hydratase
MNYTSLIKKLPFEGAVLQYASIAEFDHVEALPFSLRILLENLVRQGARGESVREEIAAVLSRKSGTGINFYPVRVFGQDILGQVMLVDLAGIQVSSALKCLWT